MASVLSQLEIYLHKETLVFPAAHRHLKQLHFLATAKLRESHSVHALPLDLPRR
jgi:hypothetical protein